MHLFKVNESDFIDEVVIKIMMPFFGLQKRVTLFGSNNRSLSERSRNPKMGGLFESYGKFYKDNY